MEMTIPQFRNKVLNALEETLTEQQIALNKLTEKYNPQPYKRRRRRN